MAVQLPQTKYEPIPEGVYPATIVDITLDDTSVYGSQLKFKFLLDAFEGYENGKEMIAWAGAKFSPKSKLFQWTQAILGKKIPEDYDFNSDDLLDKRILLVIGRNIKPDGREFDKVEGIKPLREAAAKPAPIGITQTRPAPRPAPKQVEQADDINAALEESDEFPF
jgi:hypothetical protein